MHREKEINSKWNGLWCKLTRCDEFFKPQNLCAPVEIRVDDLNRWSSKKQHFSVRMPLHICNSRFLEGDGGGKWQEIKASPLYQAQWVFECHVTSIRERIFAIIDVHQAKEESCLCLHQKEKWREHHNNVFSGISYAHRSRIPLNIFQKPHKFLDRFLHISQLCNDKNMLVQQTVKFLPTDLKPDQLTTRKQRLKWLVECALCSSNLSDLSSVQILLL